MRSPLAAGLVALAAAVLLGAGTAPTAGAAGQPPPHWSAATCRVQAAKASDHARSMIRHYSGMVYPADVEYLLLRTSLRRFVGHRCAPAILGRALRRDLSAGERRRLLELLPAELARMVRRALAGQPANSRAST